MKKYFLISLFLSLIVCCSKDDPFTETEIEVEVNLAPNDFNITIDDISDSVATINWTEATDPDDDVVHYNIYLGENIVLENISKLTYQLTDLKELTNYIGKIIAIDSNNNQTTKTFSFTTGKYYLKYLKSFDYGQVNFGVGYAFGNPKSMIKTKDENYIIAGNAQRPNGNLYHFFVLKIDYEGNEIWKKYYDYQIDTGNIKIIESVNGLILVGRHQLLSLDNNGNTIWNRKIDSYDYAGGSGEIKSVIQDLQGDIFLVGARSSSDEEIVQEAVLTKLDNLGNILWEKTFKPSLRSVFNEIIINSSNELIVLGSTETSGTTFEEYIQGPSSVEEIDFWLLKLNIEGEEIWTNTFGDGRYDIPRQIIIRNNENYVFAGHSVGAYDISKGRIFEIDPEGNELWNVTTELSFTSSIAETLDGGFITTGYVDFGNYGALGLFKFDSFGIKQWNQSYQESFTYLHGHCVLVEQDGGYRIAGSYGKNYYYDDDRPKLLIYKTDPEGKYE